MRVGNDVPNLATVMAIGFCCTVLSGCIPIPYITGHTPPSDYSRNVDEQTGISLEIGKTTRKEVLLKLGEPDKVLDEEATFIYEAESTKGAELWTLFLLLCGPTACFGADRPIGSGAEYEGYRFIVNFDQQGVVKGHHFETFKRIDKRPGQWSIEK
jgi:hypothetical protein